MIKLGQPKINLIIKCGCTLTLCYHHSVNVAAYNTNGEIKETRQSWPIKARRVKETLERREPSQNIAPLLYDININNNNIQKYIKINLNFENKMCTENECCLHRASGICFLLSTTRFIELEAEEREREQEKKTKIENIMRLSILILILILCFAIIGNN